MGRIAKDELSEIRRKLAPYVALQNTGPGYQPHKLCDAEIARALLSLVCLVEGLVDGLEKKGLP